MSAYNPYYEAPTAKAAVRFSRTEIQHLAAAVVALTIGFAYVLAADRSFDFSGTTRNLLERPIFFLASFLAVSSGFVLHEVAHKVAAIRYGCLAEFRAQMGGLGMSAFIAMTTGFMFAAPGAVHILGRVDSRENGIISIVGPATNFAIALVLFPFLLFFVDPSANLPIVVGAVATVNALLAVFNLIPAGPLDGKKVKAWSTPIWAAAMVASVALLMLTWFTALIAV